MIKQHYHHEVTDDHYDRSRTLFVWFSCIERNRLSPVRVFGLWKNKRNEIEKKLSELSRSGEGALEDFKAGVDLPWKE